MAVVDDALQFCSMFEAEVLLELMLRYWKHPSAADATFRNDLLEKTTEVLNIAKSRTPLLAELPAEEMNFVAAVWYAEWSAVESAPGRILANEAEPRRDWLDAIRRALPSCFVPHAELP
jgi:hypothetical protein